MDCLLLVEYIGLVKVLFTVWARLSPVFLLLKLTLIPSSLYRSKDVT